MKAYKILLNKETVTKAQKYLDALKSKNKEAGKYLNFELQKVNLTSLVIDDFLEILINTKKPQIFAESAVFGNGYDWNVDELSILGDISIGVSVEIYDNGLHSNPKIFSNPYNGFLIYTPGALLRNMKRQIPADWNEVTLNNNIDLKGLFQLYERRLLSPFMYINEISKLLNKSALITIPGIGCGQFAGIFRGNMGTLLEKVIYAFLTKYINLLSNIKIVYYDPFDESENNRKQIGHLELLTRPLRKGNKSKAQLCNVTDYQDENDDFSSYLLFSIVAWDHVSWPGNDFYIGSRATDDGVKAAATNSMEVMTGFTGYYHSQKNRYLPPENYQNWKDVIQKNKLKIKLKNNIYIYPSK